MIEAVRYIMSAQPIAVVGVSDKDFGGMIYRTLKNRDIKVYPVHPARSEFAEDKCFATLKDLPPDVKTAVVAVSPASALRVVDDAIAAGYTHLWFQQGAKFDDAEAKAKAAGIETVSGKCILMYAGELEGVHKFHRFLAKLLGKY
ncbi:MAG: CoA-binding protein [candidate division Zixibacteria bacterium]|nr:CoA-binding protein [candidate division Zixibacteria bacterium]